MRAILAEVPVVDSAEYGRALRARAYVESYAPTELTRQSAVRSIELLDRFGDRCGAGRSRLILAFIELMLGGDQTLIAALIDAAEHDFTKHADAWGLALAALSRFRLHLHAGALQAGIEAGQLALSRFRRLGDPWGIPWTTLWLAIAARTSGDITTASQLLAEAISCSTGLRYVTCYAHAELSGVAAVRDDHEQARRHSETTLRLAPTTGVRDSLALAHNAAGFAARLRGDHHHAEASHLHALALFEELHSDSGVTHTLCCLGLAEYHLARRVAAGRHLRRALLLATRIGRLELVVAAIEGLARVIAEPDPHTSAVLLGAADNIHDSTGIRLTFIVGNDTAQARQSLLTRLGVPATTAAMRQGRLLSLPEVEQRAAGAAAAAVNIK
jgi:tetratricopeptide (TPR) repeat protein